MKACHQKDPVQSQVQTNGGIYSSIKRVFAQEDLLSHGCSSGNEVFMNLRITRLMNLRITTKYNLKYNAALCNNSRLVCEYD